MRDKGLIHGRFSSLGIYFHRKMGSWDIALRTLDRKLSLGMSLFDISPEVLLHLYVTVRLALIKPPMDGARKVRMTIMNLLAPDVAVPGSPDATHFRTYRNWWGTVGREAEGRFRLDYRNLHVAACGDPNVDRNSTSRQGKVWESWARVGSTKTGKMTSLCMSALQYRSG